MQVIQDEAGNIHIAASSVEFALLSKSFPKHSQISSESIKLSRQLGVPLKGRLCPPAYMINQRNIVYLLSDIYAWRDAYDPYTCQERKEPTIINEEDVIASGIPIQQAIKMEPVSPKNHEVA